MSLICLQIDHGYRGKRKKVNMRNYDFTQIREKVLEWGQNFLRNDAGFIEMGKNEKDVLIFNLTFQNCLAQIVVNDVFFAPYKSVSFEAMTLDTKKAIESGQPDLIYFFYDSDDTLVEEVIEELNGGIEYCFNYIPNQLEEMYIGKKGKLNFANEKASKILHPNDINKVEEISCEEVFVCTGVQFQYLVVENNSNSMRILPRIFRNDV